MNKAEDIKDIVYYLSLPYTVTVRIDDEGDYIARIQELEGCTAHGADPNEAFANLREIQELWIEERLSTGSDIPEPEDDEMLPSGKWLQRVPRTLHLRLTELAKREQVSLNQLVTSMLSEAIVANPLKKLLKNYVLSTSLQHAWRDNIAEYGAWRCKESTSGNEVFQHALNNTLSLFSATYKGKHDYDPKEILYPKEAHNKSQRKGHLQLAGR